MIRRLSKASPPVSAMQDDWGLKVVGYAPEWFEQFDDGQIFIIVPVTLDKAEYVAAFLEDNNEH